MRELVVGLHELYGVLDVFGVAAGYRGFYGADDDHVRLDPASVDDWHKKGGTALKTTRGGFDLNKIVDGIVARGYTQSTPNTPDVALLPALIEAYADGGEQQQQHHAAGRSSGQQQQQKHAAGRSSRQEQKHAVGRSSSRHRRQPAAVAAHSGEEQRRAAAAAAHSGRTRSSTGRGHRRGRRSPPSTRELHVYAIGGDGTMRGAVAIFEEFKRRGLRISITGIPKTVDNDIGIIDRSFGFQTAVEIAQQAIDAAHVEAVSAVNGIGLVKLMGRSTGHIALHATLSSRDVDCCLIPEIDFHVEGKGGLFEFLYERIKKKGHAVVVVAEGAGQELIPRTDDQKREQDESGNMLFLDVGPWLKSELGRWWKREHPTELFTVKYIDPTYMIRAVPANATDNLYCTLLAHSAIHGIMAGFTGFVPGPINGNYSYIPLEDIAVAKNPVDVNDHKWAWVRSVTDQPDFLKP
ncbi:6-phosphofructokinase 2 [Triticum urartu]|uniref:6-phosphofructokinase 2 n=1 Tax=Triticum urartu TaxID=4572 RepID=M7Z149_TRIUA|nr:6-phosphofructokinase 2 [Triticum urartu]